MSNPLRNPSRRRRRSRPTATLAVCLGVVALVVAIAFGTSSISNSHHQEPAAGETHETSGIELAAATAPRAVFKYSVVDGGVYTPAELVHAVANDSIVAEHYRAVGVDVKQVRAEMVAADQYAYMSYRRDGQVFWTKHKVKLQQGETILTDGQTQVRSRCGNCISLEPMQPTAPDEPAAPEFDALIADPIVIASRPFSLHPTVPPGLLPQSARIDIPTDGGFAAIGGSPFGAIAPPSDDIAENTPPPSGDPLTPNPTDPFFLPPPGNPPGMPTPQCATDCSTPPPPKGDPPVIVDNNLPPIIPPGDDDPPTITPTDPETPVPVPEPATLLLVGGGLAAISRRLRTRK